MKRFFVMGKHIMLASVLFAGLALTSCDKDDEPEAPSTSQGSGDKNDDGKTDDGKNDDGKNDDGKNDDGKNDDGKNDDGKNDDGKTDDGKTDDGDTTGGDTTGGDTTGGEGTGGGTGEGTGEGSGTDTPVDTQVDKCSVQSITLSYIAGSEAKVVFENAEGVKTGVDISAADLADITENTLFSYTTVSRGGWENVTIGGTWGAEVSQTIASESVITFKVPKDLLETIKEKGLKIYGEHAISKVEIIGEATTKVLATDVEHYKGVISMSDLKSDLLGALPGYSTITVNGTFSPYTPANGWDWVAILMVGKEEVFTADNSNSDTNLGCSNNCAADAYASKVGTTFSSGFNPETLIEKFGDYNYIGINILKGDK